MVHFVRHQADDLQRLTVRAMEARQGHRVIVTYPNGRKVVHNFPDDATRNRGTSALQIALTRSGWQPIKRPPRQWLGHSSRSHQFPKTLEIS